MSKKWIMPKMTGDEEQSKFFTGVVNALIMCGAFWVAVYLIFS